MAALLLFGRSCNETKPTLGTLEEPTIKGTYKLVERQWADGTKQLPPDIIGVTTFTNDHINFNFIWKDNEGKAFSYSYLATYKLTRTGYKMEGAN